MERNLIFISHATPEDNYFAIWLASKLELLGYKVWVDVNALKSSYDFWIKIEETIKEKTCCFIFVASRASIKPQRIGIRKELFVAETQYRQEKCCIIPVRIDDISFTDLTIETIRLQAIDFYNNWGIGLKQLIKDLEDLNIPKANLSKNTDFMVRRWVNLLAGVVADVTQNEEKYTSNLFRTNLPDYLYIYSVPYLDDKFARSLVIHKYMKSSIVTFACPTCMNKYYDTQLFFQKYSVQDILCKKTNYGIYNRKIFKDLDKICVELIHKGLCAFLSAKGLLMYQEAKNELSTCSRYYFERNTCSRYREKSAKVNLAGKYYSKYWHYCLSGYFTKFPQIGFIIKSHIIFTDERGNILPDSLQISARRKKGRLFFNKQWRNLLNAAMFYLSEGKEKISISFCCGDVNMNISSKSLEFYSDVGYVEPSKRQVDDDDDEVEIL